jgi:replication factor A1
MFQICILDRHGEIECSFLNESVEMYEKLEVGKVYTFSGGYVYPGRYTHAIQGTNTYISFKKMPDIKPQPDDPSIPSVRYFFTKIIDLHSMNDKIIDVIGIIAYISPLISFYNKDNKETKLRTITIMDNTESCIEVKIWNQIAELERFDNLSTLGDTILVLKNARVKQYNQSRQLSVFQVTDILINPNLPEVATLIEWVDHKKRRLAQLDLVYKNSVCIPSTLYDIKHSWKDRMAEGYKYVFVVNICVKFVRDFDKFDCIYETCPKDYCRRKLIIGTNSQYYCLKCRKHYENCGFSYGISCKIIDNSDSVYAVGYNELGESLYGMTANEFKFLESQDSPQDYRDILSRAKDKYFTAHLSVTKLQGKLSFVIDKLSTMDHNQSLSFYISELKDILKEYNILRHLI